MFVASAGLKLVIIAELGWYIENNDGIFKWKASDINWIQGEKRTNVYTQNSLVKFCEHV